VGRPVADTVAETIAGAVAGAGVRVAYGVPGGEVVLLIDALRRAGVEFVLTHHENAAAFMAAGQGELTGIPGVCISTLGPGATNMVTGAASALLERAPMLVLTGALARSAPAGTTHQALDLNAVYAPVTKRSVAVTSENAAATIDEAIALTVAPPHGPVHLSIPADVAGGLADPRPVISAAQPNPPLAQAQNASTLTRARSLLASAKRPAIVVGLGAMRSGAAEQVRALARATGAVVATLPKAKGVFPESDPSFVGTLEMAGDDIIVELLKGADVVVMAGVDVVEFDKPWRLPAPVIHVDVDRAEPVYWRAEVQLTGNIATSLVAIATDQPTGRWTARQLARHRRELDGFVETSGPALQAWQVIRAVRTALPPNAIAVSDVGAHKMVVGQAWPSYEPLTFFMANGLSSMGYSIPLGAAACMIRPERPAVSFVGDGGLSMYLGELETLARLQLDLLVVVFLDGKLELIRRAQAKRHVPYAGTSFLNPDFEALGRAFGIATHRVGSAAELESVLPRVVAAGGIRLLAAEIDGDDYRF
jgi:acetolactate synthase-1/2/3 large subunit